MTDSPFVDADGRPVPAVTAAEMAEVDPVATDEVGLHLLSMMENSGRTLADVGVPAGVVERTGVAYTDPFAGDDRVPLRGV